MKGLKYRFWAFLLAAGCSLAPAVAQQKFRVMEYNEIPRDGIQCRKSVRL